MHFSSLATESFSLNDDSELPERDVDDDDVFMLYFQMKS